MRSDVEVLGAGELLLTGDPVLFFATACEQYVGTLRRNGLSTDRAERWTAAATHAARSARTSAVGSAEVPIATDLTHWKLIDPVTTKEAAVMLSKTPRNIVDLCRREVLTSARMIGGQWQIERSEIAARAAGVTA